MSPHTSLTKNLGIGWVGQKFSPESSYLFQNYVSHLPKLIPGLPPNLQGLLFTSPSNSSIEFAQNPKDPLNCS